VDRLWRAVENRPCVDVHFSSYPGAPGEHGLRCAVHNAGRDELPPYRICLFSPAVGRMYIFWKKHEGPLLPTQRHEHELPCSSDGGVDQLGTVLAWAARHEAAVTDPRKRSDFAFRLEAEDGNRVLYESIWIGTTLIRTLRSFRDAALAGRASADWWELDDICWRTWLQAWRGNAFREGQRLWGQGPAKALASILRRGAGAGAWLQREIEAGRARRIARRHGRGRIRSAPSPKER
jgi:hypothetical protein